MAEELGDQLAVPSWEAKMAEERVVLLAPQELVVVLAKEWEVLMVGWLAAYALGEKEHFCENRVSIVEREMSLSLESLTWGVGKFVGTGIVVVGWLVG